MAVTITRTARIDDDGTGTTGTVINNAEKTSLYNEIDTALAKVAQLAGGNAFTGNQAITAGNFTVSGAGPHTFSTASVERMRIAATGELCVNTPASIFGGLITVAGSSTPGLVIQNTNPSNVINFVFFVNSATAVAGYIAQSGATTVAYNTTSDARLKDDAGRAADLTALRAVVVHDFTWKADGRRARGVFAQEAHRVFPSAVTVGTDDTNARGDLAQPWGTDYSKFVPDLIAGWQQHDADLAELRAILAAVKG